MLIFGPKLDAGIDSLEEKLGLGNETVKMFLENCSIKPSGLLIHWHPHPVAKKASGRLRLCVDYHTAG